MSTQTKAVVQRCSLRKVLLEISQNSQQNTCAKACNFIKKETLHRCFAVNFVKFLNNTFFYRTSLVAASDSDFSIINMRRVAIIFFELGVVKNSCKHFNRKTLHDNIFV